MRLSAAVLAVAALAAAGLAPSALARGSFRDAAAGFEVDYPDTWKQGQVPNPNIKLRLYAEALPHMRCNVSVHDDPTTAAASQAQLDAELTTAIAEQFVRDGLPTGAQVKSLKARVVTVSGGKAIDAETVFVAGGGETRGREIDVFRPGRFYRLVCGGPSADYPKVAADVDRIVNWFRLAVGAGNVAAPRPPAKAAAAPKKK